MAKIEGVSNILKNLKKAKKSQSKGLEKGLKMAGLALQRDSQKLVPVNTGNLKASAFTRKVESTFGLNTVVLVGYTASYAIYVHEMIGMKLKGKRRTGKQAKGKYWDPQGKGQAKFLEAPARSRKNRIKYRKIVEAMMKKTI